MSRKSVQVSTNYGPVTIELVACDGPECAAEGQEAYMVGWYHLATQGMEVAAFGIPAGPFDFCTLNCLHKAAAKMTGN